MYPIVRKIWKLTFWSVTGLLVVLLISFSLLFWRLSSSPIQLNQFVPGIEQAASDLPGGFGIRLEGLGLFWDRNEKQIDLKALNVELVESTGSTLLNTPEVNVSLSVFALVRGVVALSSVELQDVDVKIVRREDGSFQVFKKTESWPGEDSDDKPTDFTETALHIFKVLASEADHQEPLSYLKRIYIKGSLELDDQKTGLNWDAHAVESILVGHDGVIKVDLGVSFSSPKVLKDVLTDIALTVRGDDVSARLEFSGIDPARLARADPRLAALGDLEMDLGGSVDAEMTLPNRVHNLTAKINGGPGRVTYQDYYPQPLEINSLDLQLSADLHRKSLQVSSLDVSIGEETNPLKLNVSGSAQVLEETVDLKLETGLQELKVNEFDLYWPKGIASGARNWLIDNMKAGTVDNAKLDLAMQVPTGPEAKFQLSELKGTLAYSGLTVGYFGALPPATGVTGSGTFDQRGFDLDVTRGQVNGVSIQPGKVVISGLNDQEAAISVDTQLNGRLDDLFAVLESPPLELNFSTYTGVVSDHLAGQVFSDFSIALPLKAGLRGGDIQYQANGRITNGRLGKVVFDYELQEADLDFSLDRSKLSFRGPLKFSGIPLTLDWTTFLSGSDKGHANFTVDAPNVTGTQISALGYEVNEYVQGSVAVKSSAKLTPGGLITATIKSDFNNAELEIPQIHWHKATGEGGSVDFSLSIEKDHLHAEDINIELGKLKTSGDVQFDMAGPVMSVSLEHLSLSYAQLKGLKLERGESKNLKFTLQGGEASLEPFLSRGDQKLDPQEEKVAVQSEALASRLKASGIVFEIGESKLDKVYVNKDTYFDNIQFSGRRDNGGWQEVKLSGHNPFAGGNTDANAHPEATEKLEAGQFSLSFGPGENGQYPLNIETEDLGSVVSAVKGRNIMRDGYLVLNGDSEGPLFTKPIKATFKLNHFTMKEAPAISRVLNMASLTQIVSTFRQTGLAFNSASGDIQLNGSRLSTTQIRAKGGSLGMLVGGWADLKTENLGLHGTVIPLNNINKLVGMIPLFGKVVVGKDGRGIMAVDFTVKGTVSQPEASIWKEALTTDLLDDTVAEDKEGTSPNPQ
ncbi:MAG: DUF3971 domain-containing protein [Xanthomonadales bacterium]|nr:DUF3971 domain-containing protein [Xanthomonadales bacterium]